MSVYIITATISCLIIWLEEKVSDKDIKEIKTAQYAVNRKTDTGTGNR